MAENKTDGPALRPGFFARRLVARADWRLSLEGGDLALKNADGERRIPIESLEQIAVRRGVVWARILAETNLGAQVVLPGLRNAVAGRLRDDLRRRFTARRLAAVGDLADAPTTDGDLDAFYARDQYLADRDARLWLESAEARADLANRPGEEAMRRLRNHPLFDEWVVPPGLMQKWRGGDKRVRDLSGERAELRERNRKFVAREMEAHRDFFDRVEKTPLTDEQRRAAVVMEDRNLLVAAAGSGKTSAVVGKIGYALKREICRPDEIVALAFNKKAAAELRERIQSRLGEVLNGGEVEATTFHALGLKLVGEATRAKPRVAEWAGNLGDNAGQKTAELIGELIAASPDFLARWVDLFAGFRWQMKPRHKFKSWLEYNRHLEAVGAKEYGQEGIPTIKGDRVKSLEERAIADYLFANGVEYEYERPYERETADATHGQYKPDFYYPRANLYHEHFALDARGRAPDFMGGDEYVRGVEWKRRQHKENGTRLIETTSAMFRSGDVFEHLRGELTRHGAFEGVAPPSPAEVYAQLREQDTRPIYNLMSTFLSHWKSGGWTRADILARLDRLEGFARARARAFLEVMFPFREFYDKRLRDNNEIDFDDMLSQAAAALRSGAVRRPCKLILADEFQDISRARAELLRALLEQNPDCKLFAVGDDWQAIYRFGGADIFIMTNFRDEFGATERDDLTRTFRSNQGIADVAAKFVRANPAQMDKEVRATDPARAGVVNVVRYPWDEDAATVVESKLREIAQLAEAGGRRKVFILGRYNHLSPAQLPAWKKRFAASLDIEFLTMHRAKGLEADYVIVLGMNAGRSGFPGEREDDPALGLVMPRAEDYEFAEERRLFYVALTRARRKVCLLARQDRPSRFVEEIVRDGGGAVADEVADPFGATSPARRCPRCGEGFLVERKGPYGAFYGCSDYPACDHTQDARPAPAARNPR